MERMTALKEREKSEEEEERNIDVMRRDVFNNQIISALYCSFPAQSWAQLPLKSLM